MRPPHQREDPGGRVGIGEGRDAGVVEDLLAGPDRRRRPSSWRAPACRGSGRTSRAASAVAVGSLMACGVRITSSPSMFGSCGGDLERPGVSRWRRRRPGCRSGCHGSRPPAGRRRGSSGSSRSSSASSPPASIRASVARTPGPPALVTIASRGPRGRGCLASTSAMSKTCEIESTRSTPHAAERGVEHLVAAGQRAGVRRRRLRRRLGPPRLDHDDRLGQRHLARRREERPRIADRSPCRSRCTWSRGRPPGSRSGRPSRRRASSRSRRTR